MNINSKISNKLKEKLLTPRISKKKSNSKQKSFIHIIQKEDKAQSKKFYNLPFLTEIISILKKTKKDRTFQDINKLNDFLTAKYDYFKRLRNTNDDYQYSRTLAVLKYTEVPQGKNIVTFDEEGDRCYIVLEGEVSVLKPVYIVHKMTIKDYVDYLKECDKNDPSNITRKRIIEKNNHIITDVNDLLDMPSESLEDPAEYNIFVESFEKVFQSKDGFTFGEAALLHKQRRNATVRAENFCKLIYIDKLDYNKIMKESEKKRIDEEIKYFKDKFYLFSNWGYINMHKLYSLMTDVNLYKNEVLFRQNEDSEYIYFIINGTCEKYSYISLSWKKQFVDYISDFSSNFFLRINTTKSLNSIKLMKLIIEAKKSVQPSPMAFRDFNFGKFNLSLSNKKDINDLILNKDEKFSDPYDLFKVSMNKLSDKDIIGIEEVTEFKKRFSTIKVTSDFAHLKRIKAIDFFKIYINNFSREKEDYLILNYICEKKRMLVKQIELLSSYKKKKEFNKYIEEYNNCYNNINTKQRQINKKMQDYINTLSKTKRNLNKSKNIFLRKISKLKNLSASNYFYKSNEFEKQKNDLNDSQKYKSSSKINYSFKTKLSCSKIYLYQRNYDNLDYKLKFDSPKSKFSSFSPSTKNQTITKLKDDSSIPNNTNNKSISFYSNKSSFTLKHNNFMKLNKSKNFFSLSYDKNIKENDLSKKYKKSRNIKIKDNNLISFNSEEYKKNLYCKYGFFINEFIKLGLGPRIPLRKNLTHLHNEINLYNNKNSLEQNKDNKKGFYSEKEIRKRRYEFLKITEL